jgi:hypothetical protein
MCGPSLPLTEGPETIKIVGATGRRPIKHPLDPYGGRASQVPKDEGPELA